MEDEFRTKLVLPFVVLLIIQVILSIPSDRKASKPEEYKLDESLPLLISSKKLLTEKDLYKAKKTCPTENCSFFARILFIWFTP